MIPFEKLGVFYLGRIFDVEKGARGEEPLLYDAKDLTTHGLCVGMTGSGKTGLCMALIEEAAIDGIPVIAVDPKGDIANLMLQFPDLEPSDFAPWVDPGEAVRQGLTVDGLARKVADRWREGLAEWGQDGDRIRRLRETAETLVYTPGSTAGRPLTVLRSFAAPPAGAAADPEAARERVVAAVSGLLGLLGIDADPLTGREAILLSTLLAGSWEQGRDLSLADLVVGIRKPPFDRVGAFDLETFYPADERLTLALRVNALLSSPGFRGWMEGAPLNVQDLLYAPDGRPRVSILSIAHLSDGERMFFVTILLNELLSWMRQQPGTGSLRALFYMDEIFGYVPPTRNPPSKTPMLTLLKQARAFGLGILLATQNPVDLDYKGLSNTGTWFIGRLQTERDMLRVLDGLEGAPTAGGAAFDRARIQAVLSGLASRTFLMHDVHEDAPVTFETRWVLSYLRGPLTRRQIETITAGRDEDAPVPGPAPPSASAPPAPGGGRPAVPPGVEELFLPPESASPPAYRRVFRPALFAEIKVRYARAALGVDTWEDLHLLLDLPEDGPVEWSAARRTAAALPAEGTGPPDGDVFCGLPPGATHRRTVDGWRKALAGHVYRERPLEVFRCRPLKAVSAPGESEAAFRGRLAHLARERRDREVEAVRERFAKRLAACGDALRRAEGRLARESQEVDAARLDTAVSIGATLIGALFGRKLTGHRTVSGAGAAVRRVQRVEKEKGDVERARAEVAARQEELLRLEAACRDEVAAVETEWGPGLVEVEKTLLPPRKTDIHVSRFGLAWVPWAVSPGKDGIPLHPAGR
jgi:hypothetical protein